MKFTLVKIVIAVIAALSLLYLSVSLIYKPIISSDAMNGMLSLNNYLNGAGWNHVLGISKDGGHVEAHELTWWAPGQYELPYLFAKIFSINIGAALSLLMFLSVACGCFFYHKIFRSSSIDNRIVFGALLLLLTQRFLNIYFIQYNSSDIFLFFMAPFYIFCYQRLVDWPPSRWIWKIALLTLINIAGLFIKNSFILFELAVNIFLFIEFFSPQGNTPKFHELGNAKFKLWRIVQLIVPFVLANVLNYWFFLRLGENPTHSPGLLLSFSNILKGIFVPVIQVLFSSLSLNSIYGNFYDKISLPGIVSNLIMLFVLSLLGYILYQYRQSIINELKKNVFARLTATIAVMYVLYWFVFTIKQSYISNEDRLYLPAGILVLPYLLRFALNSTRIIRYSYGLAVIISVIYGGYTFVYRIKKYAINGSEISENRKLGGFKVYSTTDNLNDLRKIATIIAARYPNEYIVVDEPDYAFKLNVTNKFIVAKGTTPDGRVITSQNVSYLLLKDSVSLEPALQKVYTSGDLILYKP